jgi:hypothetical protein
MLQLKTQQGQVPSKGTGTLSLIAARRISLSDWEWLVGGLVLGRNDEGLSLKDSDSAAICSREGSGRLGRFRRYGSHEKAFWATLERHRRRETAPPLAKNTSVALQQGPVRRTRPPPVFC